MKIAFETDGIFLLDLIKALKEVGYEKGLQYTVLGKFGSYHHIQFNNDCVRNFTPLSFTVFISFMMPGAWHSKVRPVP